MSSKTVIYIGMVVGGYVGSYLPTLWGADYFSFSSIIFGMFGGIIGIIIGFKLSHY